jgi:preprotein translocase subunit SecD
MSQNLMWRGLVILGVVVACIVSFVPPKEKIGLGLDLRGGMHLELRVNTEDALRSETDKDMERLRQELAEVSVTGAATNRTGDSAFEVTGIPVDSDEAVGKAASESLPGWDWRRSGDVLLFTMVEQNARAIQDQSVQQAVQTIRNRVDEFGVAEPVIQRKGISSDRIVVQLPGVDDPERVKRLIKNTAFLEFRLVDSRGGGVAGSKEQILSSYGGTLPDNVEIFPGDQRDRQGRTIGQQFYPLEKRRVISGRDLKNARPGLGQFNEPIVNFSLTAEGGRLFGDATGNNIGSSLAIVLDGKVVSAPRINNRITDSGLIEGGFTQKEVEDLSAVLRSGALPAGITYLEERTVGPSLGQDSIRSGVTAGLVGALLTVLTMFVIYRFTGFNAMAALAVNVILVLGGLAAFDATLTLPGIAGIILTIGMAFDANVLVFERIREELALGRTVRTSIDAGFTKAMSSIMDANICTLIAALFLFQFGTGPVRGFAVTLSIGVLSTLFAGVFFSRWLFDAVLQRRAGVERLSI